MCTSVPQIVVAVIRITASPARGVGLGTSSTAIRFLPLNTTAFIVAMISTPVSELAGQRPYQHECSGSVLAHVLRERVDGIALRRPSVRNFSREWVFFQPRARQRELTG